MIVLCELIAWRNVNKRDLPLSSAVAVLKISRAMSARLLPTMT